jgi:hypothetical protein
MSDDPTPPDELASITRWLSRHYVHPWNEPKPDPVPRWLSRAWFFRWLAGRPDRIAFIDARFDEAALRAELARAEGAHALDVGSWLVMLLRRHGRHDEADALMEELVPGRKPKPKGRPKTTRSKTTRPKTG